jgi:glycosyltransferase involved in cell wall biosynthesis
MKAMKIAHVIESMHIGGAEMIISQMCRFQREQGHQPSVYAFASEGLLGAQLKAEGFPVHSNIGLHLVKANCNFYRLFREFKPDVVHLHNPVPTIYAAVAARMAGVPSIVSTRHSLVAPPYERRMEWKYALASRCCDWIVGICDTTAKNVTALHRTSAKKIVRVYNGANPLLPVAPEQRPAKNGFTLLYVGRLEPVKNLSLLLNAFAAARASHSELRLWIVGDGSERKALEQLAAELGLLPEVTFWGRQLDVAPYFSAADTFIMSSWSEGLPMSLLQAFSLGVPAIVTDVGGMAEVARMAQGGMIVPAGDSAAMAAAILRMVDDAAGRKQFSAKAQEAFQSSFTIQTMADSYMKLYRDTPRMRGILQRDSLLF